MEMENKEHIWERLARHFTGHSSEQEKMELEQWLLQATEEELDLYESARKLWKKTALKKDAYLPDTNKGWKSFQLKVRMRAKPKKTFPYIKVAAAVLLLSIFTFLLLKNDPPEMIRRVADEEVKLINLPDGSRVWLNHQAVVSYPQTYNVENREVYLEGEAFFEVKKAEGKRFTVFTESTKTEVIGTSFNLRAIPNEPVAVQVATGKVAFSSLKHGDAIFLTPGEEARFSAEKNDLITRPIEDANFRAWQNKQLVFQNTNLKELSKTIEDYFHITIRVPDELSQCRFTVSFKDPDIQEVLNVLAITGNLKVTKIMNGYELTGNGCE